MEQEVRNISTDEVRKALEGMKNRRAVGPDDAPVEVWTCIGEMTGAFLMKRFKIILDREKMPE